VAVSYSHALIGHMTHDVSSVETYSHTKNVRPVEFISRRGMNRNLLCGGHRNGRWSPCISILVRYSLNYPASTIRWRLDSTKRPHNSC